MLFPFFRPLSKFGGDLEFCAQLGKAGTLFWTPCVSGNCSYMRLDEATINAAIQHPEEEVRLTAVDYFSDSYSEDETVRPLVIQAVETYGVETSFKILRDAELLPLPLTRTRRSLSFVNTDG